MHGVLGETEELLVLLAQLSNQLLSHVVPSVDDAAILAKDTHPLLLSVLDVYLL